MRKPFVRSPSGTRSLRESWIRRVRENASHLFASARFRPSSANGAPIHLLKFDKTSRPARAQTASLIAHALLFLVIALVVAHPPGGPNSLPRDRTKVGPLTFSPGILKNLLGRHPSDGQGSGGGKNAIPTNRENLAPTSSIQIVRPSIPERRDWPLPVPPTVFDPNAAPVLTPVDNIGLPWMKDETHSPGPGKGHTIGSSDGNTMGDSKDGPGGHGDSPYPFSPGVTLPTCNYCPYPTYTDEARHVKVQGTVTLHVLVGADGRAQDIRIVKGLGYGLDERAMETVRGWRFVAARDGARRAVAAWVTVEAVFRLF